MTREINRNQTSRPNAEELNEMYENVERFRLLVENSNDLVVEVSLEGEFLYISPNVKAVLGREPDELLHTSIFDYVHADDLSHVQEVFALPEGRATCRYRHKDGSWRWVETTGRDFLTSDGEKRGVLIARDVTERKNAEESARQSEERIRAIVENALDAVITMSADGLLTDWNTQAEKIFGWKRNEVIGQKMSEILISERFRYVHEEGMKNFLASNQISILNRRLEMVALCRDRQEIPIELAIIPLKTTQGIGFCGFIRDLTEQKESQRAKTVLEAQLRHAQKLEAVGRLAGGIAHDFNNILTVVMAYTELAYMEADNSVDARKYLAEIRNANERAKDLVQQILTFSRKQKQERKPTLLPLVIKEVLKLMRPILPSTIEIDLQIDLTTPLVLADPSQIHQVMMNLCTNAAHAMKERPGRLTVALQPCEVDDALAKTLHDVHPGKYVQLSVRDTGHGMDEETLKRIFEPFFTTKHPGEGTGLGLPVVHGIVKEHEGDITVESQLDVGTTFTIYFPAYQCILAEKPETPQVLSYGNGEHILFIDDEPAICSSAQIVLERLGYRVTAQTNPDEALLLFRSRPDAFQLVITDLTMPQITGIDLAQQISQIRPGIPILLATGYIGKWIPDKVSEFGIDDVIPKPMTTVSLAATVRRVLDAPKRNNPKTVEVMRRTI